MTAARADDLLAMWATAGQRYADAFAELRGALIDLSAIERELAARHPATVEANQRAFSFHADLPEATALGTLRHRAYLPHIDPSAQLGPNLSTEVADARAALQRRIAANGGGGRG